MVLGSSLVLIFGLVAALAARRAGLHQRLHLAVDRPPAVAVIVASYGDDSELYVVAGLLVLVKA